MIPVFPAGKAIYLECPIFDNKQGWGCWQNWLRTYPILPDPDNAGEGKPVQTRSISNVCACLLAAVTCQGHLKPIRLRRKSTSLGARKDAGYRRYVSVYRPAQPCSATSATVCSTSPCMLHLL